MRDQDRLSPSDWRASARAAWGAFWPSRLIVFGVAMWVTIAPVAPNEPIESGLLSHPFGNWPATGLLELVLSPLAKWDAQHYLAIAYDGYVQTHAGLPPANEAPAFFPLYPGIVHVLSGFGAGPGIVLVVAYAVSLSGFFAALTLLHRLAVIEIGERYAKPALMLLAFFPAALFFGIPYSESLFLLLAVGAFLAARTGHWATAGVVLALASATRVPGLLLVVPVALLYLYGPRADRDPESTRGGWRPRYRLRPDAAWLLLAPLGIVAFSAYLHFALGDALSWEHAQVVFGRHTVDPFTGAWDALREAGASLGRIVSRPYTEPTSDHLNVAQIGFVALALAGGIGALRRLPVAYGAWVLVSLAPLFVSQTPDNPLWSSPRFIAVLFPVFLWLAIVCERREATTTVIALFAAGLSIFTGLFALWSFIA
ncbi:MAG TPA: mannosyltransferase family protein [Solirubrobacterales bacterium]|nr:mannosyltransferase family protein [Solirubrobacterales bacterium]